MNISKTIALTLGTLFSTIAFAGGMEGGGGVGVRCGTSLELLEVHEARIRGVQMTKAPETQEEAIDFVSRKVGEAFWYPLFDSKEEYIQLGRGMFIEPIFLGKDFFAGIDDNDEEIYAKIEYVKYLPLSNDYGSYEIRKHCSLEQIAYFEDGKNPKLQIVESAWKELDWLSKSILVAHETFYAMDRNAGSIRDLARINLGHNSEWTRNYLIKLFSLEGVKGVVDGLPLDRKYLKCSSADQSTSFYTYDSSAGANLIFIFIMDHSEFYQVKSEVQGLISDDLLNGSALNKNGKIVFTDSNTNPGLEIVLQRMSGAELELKLVETKSGRQIRSSQTIYCN